MKQIGKIYWAESKEVLDLEEDMEGHIADRPVWADVYKGDEDSEIVLWGIVMWNIPKKVYDGPLGWVFEEFREEFQKQTGYKVKKKYKGNSHGKYYKLYIPRPAEKMDEVLEALNEFDYDELDGNMKVNLDETDFQKIKRAEVAKSL